MKYFCHQIYEAFVFSLLFIWEIVCCLLPRKAKRWIKTSIQQAGHIINSK